MNIEDLASVHLGKAGDGTIVKPYITPDFVDPSLLVGVPRVLNRTAYGIDNERLPFVGNDVWHCYEFSCLLANGNPFSCVVKIVYSSNSVNIVESKSLKLYLNSYNMAKMGNTIKEVRAAVKNKIRVDLTPVLGVQPNVGLITNNHRMQPFTCDFDSLETALDIDTIAGDAEMSTLLVDTDNKGWIADSVCSSSLRSNCRVTNQPDWGDVFIFYSGDLGVMRDDLYRYIVSLRKENHFHEEICEMIYQKLFTKLKPKFLLVACLYTRRGGIDINPIRANNNSMLSLAENLMNCTLMTEKTLRQ